jgi:excisionase family DNA binding protein
MAELLSVSEAARRLGMTTEACYELVFARRLRTVESDTGRRLVPVDAIEDWLASQPPAPRRARDRRGLTRSGPGPLGEADPGPVVLVSWSQYQKYQL